MKAELLYIRIERDANGCFDKMEFNFSACCRFHYDHETHKIEKRDIHERNIFADEHIAKGLIGFGNEDKVLKCS